MKVTISLFILLIISNIAIAQWSNDPTVNNPICIATDQQRYQKIISDGIGGAIIVWTDNRNSATTGYDIYAQKINSQGITQWTTNGVEICLAINEQSEPLIISDGNGGAIFVWNDERRGNNYYDIYAQRINACGVKMWDANGVLVKTAIYPFYSSIPTSAITADEMGGAIITWKDNRTNYNTHIYAQKINSDGIVQWMTNGIAICTTDGDQEVPKITEDGVGGAIITWEDSRSGDNDIYAQRINSSGTIQWAENGNVICQNSGWQSSPIISNYIQGGVIIAWIDMTNQSNWNIYAQKVDLNGLTLWSVNGISVCSATNMQYVSDILTNWGGEAIIVWVDYRNGETDKNIYIQKLNSNGTSLWGIDGTSVCTAIENQMAPKLVDDGKSGAIVVWEDERNTYTDIYAQKIDSIGTKDWITNGIAICTAYGYQSEPVICSDKFFGAIMSWYDFRDWGNYDIYAAQIDGEGNLGNPTTNFQLIVNVAEGWNLTSIPGLHPVNQNVNTWWPGRDPAANVFEYNGSYVPITDVAPGEGYWMKNLVTQTYNTGDEWPTGGIQIVTNNPNAIHTGWNLIGVYEFPIDVNELTTEPSGLQLGSIYGYDGGYVVASMLYPGYGYWFKSSGEGLMYLTPCNTFK